MLRRLGFRTLAEVDGCIEGYDCDAIGRLIFGSRLNPGWRLQAGLLAAMGEVFLERHPLAEEVEAQTYIGASKKLLEENHIMPRPREQLPTTHD
jgi:hypothetical protein